MGLIITFTPRTPEEDKALEERLSNRHSNAHINPDTRTPFTLTRLEGPTWGWKTEGDVPRMYIRVMAFIDKLTEAMAPKRPR